MIETELGSGLLFFGIKNPSYITKELACQNESTEDEYRISFF